MNPANPNPTATVAIQHSFSMMFPGTTQYAKPCIVVFWHHLDSHLHDTNLRTRGNSPMFSSYLGSVSTPVWTSWLWSKFSASKLSGNCHTGIGECQISGQSNPAFCLPSTKANQSRISLGVLFEQLIGRLIGLRTYCSNKGHFPNVLSKMSKLCVFGQKSDLFYLHCKNDLRTNP
jgi:hypothetical protein